MKRMKRWMGIMLAVMLAVGSLQVPVIAAEEGATAEVAVETEEVLPVQEETEPESGLAAEETEQKDNSEEIIDEIIPEEITSVAAMDSESADIVDSGTCGDSLTWKLDSEGTLTISGTGEMSSDPWRSSHSSEIKKAVLEDGVTNIGINAFSDCSNLTSIKIPDSVTSIWKSAFYNCSSLTSITIPKNVISIGWHAFWGCNNLTSIMIPDSVTSIGTYAFRDCNSLTGITIPNGVTSIEYGAFYNCSSLASITIPKNVTNIEGAAFAGCNSLTSITIPNGVTDIGSGAFSNCSSLTSISIPDSVTSIGDGTFWSCNNLTSIIIPKGVTSIGIDTFSGCTGLTSITIPDSVTGIGDNAFSDCSSLTSITIPEGATSIGKNAFSRCKQLTSITIPDGVTSIGEDAFFNCSSLTSITIPNSVTSISDWTFSSCSSLTSITLPDSITSIGEGAFADCYSLTNLTIPNGVTSIGDHAFIRCSDFTSITIPEGVKSIGSEVFQYCPNITAYVYSGSYAEEYVKSAGVQYKTICKNHTWNEEFTIDKNPTYTEEGSKSIHCSVCDAIKEGSSVSIPKLVNQLGKTTRGDMFNLANNVKVTWKEVPGAKYYKVYREGITDKKESQKEPVIVTERLVGWDSQPGLTNGHAYRYKIVASLTGKGDFSGDSPLSYSKLMYRLKTVVIRSAKNTEPGKVTVKYDKTTSGDSYVLQYCEREDMVGAKTKVVLGASNTSYTIGGLKKGKTYYISIRVRKKVNGIDYYTTFGVPKKVKIEK